MKKTDILLLLLVIIGIFYFYKNQEFILPLLSNKISSSYNPIINENPTDSGFVKPEHKLIKIFDSISSSSKIKINGTCQRFIFNKNTIDTKINEYLIQLLKNIINSLNQISSTDYYLKEIENVYAMMNHQGKRFIIDFFIYDIKNHYTIRLLADIVIVNDEEYINYLHLHTGSNPLLINKYDIKYRSSGILFDINMFQENIDQYFDNYYKQSFQMVHPDDNLTSVFNVDTLKNMYIPSSISNDTYNELKNKELSSYLEMYLPENQNTIKSPTFCQKYTLDWDNKGIFNNSDIQKNDCYFNNEQTISEINEPWFGPGIIHQRISQNNYDWLINKGNIKSSL